MCIRDSALIKQNKLTFKIDTILPNHGHSVLQLLHYQPDFNPMELTWATVKKRVERENVHFSVDSVKGILLYFSCRLEIKT